MPFFFCSATCVLLCAATVLLLLLLLLLLQCYLCALEDGTHTPPFFFCNVTCVLLADGSIPAPSCHPSEWYGHLCMRFFFCNGTCVVFQSGRHTLLTVFPHQCYMCAVEDGRHTPVCPSSVMLHVCCAIQLSMHGHADCMYFIKYLG